LGQHRGNLRPKKKALELMAISGCLSKMVGVWQEENDGVLYHLKLDNHAIPLNELLGKPISLKFSGEILCTHCQRKIKKTYAQGYCFPCAQTLAAADLCILRPETCHYHKGTCREPRWGEENCLKPHVLYLANTSGLKVGITRAVNLLTRWVDQGASQAVAVLSVDERRDAGLLETILKKEWNDKTNWRQMLKGEPVPLDLNLERQRVWEHLDSQVSYQRRRDDPIRLTYPVSHYPKSLKSISLDKTPGISEELLGIKGQYLFFPSGVLNVRKHTGYRVELTSEFQISDKDISRVTTPSHPPSSSI
jgi:hypothetical protein